MFEVGPAVEPTRLAISQDGTTWTEVGDIRGGTAAVDGADVDAIGAIGSALRLSFDASVLFDFDRSALKPEAQAALTDAATQIAAYKDAAVTVEGHTDNVGAAGYNAKLSQARAASVRAFLLSRPELRGRTIVATGFGANRPLESNTTEEGRRQNRRVEIVVTPKQ